MAYTKLSEQVQQLSNPQRSDRFVKLFREAVRAGTISAIPLPERFALPKQFRQRGTEGHYQKDAKEMLFEPTPEFEAWFEHTNQALAMTRARSIKPSVEAIETGLLDFKALAEATRLKMQASFDKGQALGQRRSKTRKGSR